MTTITNAPALISTLEGALRTISILEARVKELEEGQRTLLQDHGIDISDQEEEDEEEHEVTVARIHARRVFYRTDICGGCNGKVGKENICDDCNECCDYNRPSRCCECAFKPDPVWIEKLNNLREKYEQEICSCVQAPWIYMDHVNRPCEGFPNTCGDCEGFVPPEVRGAGGVPEEEPHCEKCL